MLFQSYLCTALSLLYMPVFAYTVNSDHQSLRLSVLGSVDRQHVDGAVEKLVGVRQAFTSEASESIPPSIRSMLLLQ